MYQRQCEIAEKPISIAFHARVSSAKGGTEKETIEEAGDEFDKSSDEEVDDSAELSMLVNGEIGSSVNVSSRSKNSLWGSCAFQQSPALLTSSSDYGNF